MKKNQQIVFLILISIFATAFAVVQGNDAVDGRTIDEKEPPLTLSATAFYLKPNIDDSHYVLSSFDNTFSGSLFPKGKHHQNPTSFTPGFNVECLYELCSNSSFLDLRFTYLNACSKASVAGDFLYDTNGFPGFGAQASPIYSGVARSKNSYNFYAGDLTYQHTFSSVFPDQLTFIVGLHSAYIEFREHTISSGTFLNNDVRMPLQNDLQRNSRFYGIGPQFGINYEYLLPNPCQLKGQWTLHAEARGALLCGFTKSDLRYVTLRTGPGGIGFFNGDVWRVVPSASSELGVKYVLDCASTSAMVELGYEFMWYSDCVNKITGLDVAFTGDVINVFNSFSLHGPYLRIGIAF